MRRLAIFWLACAAIGFLAAVGAAIALGLALDGTASWRASQPRVVEDDVNGAPSEPAPVNAVTNAPGKPQGMLAPLLGSAG